MRILPLAIVGIFLQSGFAQVKPVPVDPELPKQIQSAIEQARAESDPARALREFNRLLEVYPNEPLVRAPMYLAMSELSGELGDANQSRAYRATALAINPGLDAATTAAPAAEGKRGSADKIAQYMTIATQMMAQVQQMRAQSRAQQPMQAAPIQQPMQQAPVIVGYDANNQPIYSQQQQPMQQPMQQPIQQPMQQAGGPMSPAAQAPQAPQAPMIVGYDANNQPIYNSPQQPMQQPMAAGGPMTPSPQQPTPQQAYPQQSAYQQPPAPMNPYAMRAAPRNRPTRGETQPLLIVVYDRSRSGDDSWFHDACQAILDFNEPNTLTVTPACADAPMTIPASEITAIRMNVAVAKEAGAFHIETAKGLYLMLTTETEAREDSAEAVRVLRTALDVK